MADLEIVGRFTEDYKFIEIDPDHCIPRMLKKYQGINLDIILAKQKRSRTSAQNRYFHGVVCVMIIADAQNKGEDWVRNLSKKEAMAYTKAHIYKNVLKQRLVVAEIDGMEVYVQSGKRMSEMNTLEFTDAVEEVRTHYGEKGLNIPDPIKYGYIANYINAQKR